ncbi:hypothetical protein BJ878DRAFT_569300 [Calycina marina]|uniref:Small ribosomal subunit protein mS38 n=1 Tax=Calycina marina TaxID=1763456 RepID=A0A9P8CCZ4_9HELO|nr:hypothetical protein BJ878DRAFT_569300 [Calycina marina]
MFSSSVRRVGLIAPQVPIIATFTSSAPRAVAVSTALSYRSHQRRLSSSKPSNPSDGSNGDSTGQNVVAQPHPSRLLKKKLEDEGKLGHKVDGEKDIDAGIASKPQKKGRKKAKAASDKAFADVSQHCAQTLVNDKTVESLSHELYNVYPVPNTDHIAPSQIAQANFFSLHRPISITMSIPQPVTEDAFATIFKPWPKPNTGDVVATITNTLKNLDDSAAQMKATKSMGAGPRQAQWNAEPEVISEGGSAQSQQKQVMQLDELPQETKLEFPKHILTGTYQPFHPPPPPVPQHTLDSLAAGAETVEPQLRRYTTVVTIDESTDANGEVTYAAHSSPLLQQESIILPTRFLQRMHIRQINSRIRHEEQGFFAISVKRQRKLKMKKHKYKKLMKRTRTLRRKLDRT